jgi:glycosyltransferase involved in cell wall biosynthesis
VSRRRRILFIQATEPAGYPPLVHAASLLAAAGWDVTFLSAPIAGHVPELPRHPGIGVRRMAERPSHVMRKADYGRYVIRSIGTAIRLRPDVVYASDPNGAVPGLLAARTSGASLVYHEHDSPAAQSMPSWLARMRSAAARHAKLVIFPNKARADAARGELHFAPERLRVVWNVPCLNELPTPASPMEPPLILYYHGGITPDRLPLSVVEAVQRLQGRVRLHIVGREAPGASGYLAAILAGSHDLVSYAGQFPHRADILAHAARAHVGLALIPSHSADINMRHMTGASNKAFDYMAAGLPLLVSDLQDWRQMFVQPGYARACDPGDAGSIAAALGWFVDHPLVRAEMARRSRGKIETQWNYDRAFAPVISALSNTERTRQA